MKTIEPLDWEVINAQLMGRPLEEATQIFCKLITDKVNEVVEASND